MVNPVKDKKLVTNPPENLTMLDVMGVSQQYGGLAKSCRYFVRIRPQGTSLLNRVSSTIMPQLSYLCEAAEMPGRGFMNLDGRYHGPNFKLPFQSQYEDTSMTFLCRSGSFERMFFDDWMELINPTHRWTFTYRDDYSSLVDIYQLTSYPDPSSQNPTAPMASYQWTLHDAYPIVVNPQQVTWADDNFQRLTITFTYTRWTRPKLDVKPKGLRNESDFIVGSTVTGLPTNSKM